jgi:hypothetical protein
MDNAAPRGLMWWDGAEADPMAGLACLMAHPALGLAVRAMAANMRELLADDRTLDSLLKDAGRYVAAMGALYLHDTGGLTLARLKAFCTRSSLLSPGRARALLLFLEHLGYVERTTAPGAGALYVPTASFRAAWRAQLRAALEAGRVLEPQLDWVLDSADPQVLETFGGLHAKGLVDALEGGMPVLDFLRVFIHPHAGHLIVGTLMTTAQGEAFPPERAGPISVSALSRSFGVSRIHISRIFADAEREGLARLDRDGMVHFEPKAREEMTFFNAAQFAQILAAAAKTVRAHGLVETRAALTA